MIGAVVALVSGALFALGLVLAGMTDPSKIIGFLDVSGDWDPSLALVMGGAIPVMIAAFAVADRMRGPLGAPRFVLTDFAHIDARLVIGAALFGAGWALSGFCPGPAVVAFGALRRAALVFVPAMLLGMYFVRLWDERSARRSPEVMVSQAPTSQCG